MVKRHQLRSVVLITIFVLAAAADAEEAGGIRGTVYDKEFDSPLGAAQVLIAETGEKVTATDEGTYVFGQVKQGTYTLVFSKEGYTRQVKADVVVSPGKMTEVDATLSGEFTEMEEFVVQDIQVGSGTEAALLDIRMETPALMDSVSSELMSKAGAGDAASALNLVAGTTVQEGKYAVVRGLPDRYVNSQINGVRLPTADTDKRAVQLDQFPSAAIESIQVNKTFTPDQQGDASGGAVNIVTKSIPEETILQASGQLSWNTQAAGKGDFLTYKGGGLNFWGIDDGGRDIQTKPPGAPWDGAAGVTSGDSPQDYKWSIAGGGKHQVDEDIKIGGFGSFFYERDSSFFDNGIDDQLWAVKTPVYDPASGSYNYAYQVQPQISTVNEIRNRTSLFDVTKASQEAKWGALGTIGLETENHFLGLTYLYTHAAEDKVTLAEDTRGKAYYFPGYNPDNPADPGNSTDYDSRYVAPYRRTETLEYTERTTETIQLHGRHTLFDPAIGIGEFFKLRSPELDWTVAKSFAGLNQPDKRLFGSYWLAPNTEGSFWGFWEDKGANYNLGNFQRIWKEISEESDQYALNLKLPFEQWSGDEGYLKFGVFNDEVTRKYEQESFSNTDGEYDYWLYHDWSEFWSSAFPDWGEPIYASDFDIDYDGEQKISAWYYMADVPLCSFFNIIGGFRFEKTELSITNAPDRDSAGNITAVWYEPVNGIGPMAFDPQFTDVTFQQDDVLPSLGFEFRPFDKITLRGSYSETVARQTFKELSPIVQQEYLGGPVFIGNPALKMSALKNYDLRLDWTPYEGGLYSMSYFTKEIKDPIEFEQGYVGFPYTYPINYPEGKLSGFEFEVRQQMERFFDSLEGLSIGANATFIDSEVTLPDREAQQLQEAGVPAPTRDMSNTPEHLYNLFLTYNMGKLGLPDTDFAIFYTVRGDTLVAGGKAGGSSFIPDVYETEYGTLNLSLSHKLWDIWTLKFQAKNLLDPEIETVYRSKYIGDDVTKTSYRKGEEFSISLSAEF